MVLQQHTRALFLAFLFISSGAACAEELQVEADAVVVEVTNPQSLSISNMVRVDNINAVTFDKYYIGSEADNTSLSNLRFDPMMWIVNTNGRLSFDVSSDFAAILEADGGAAMFGDRTIIRGIGVSSNIDANNLSFYFP